MPKSQGQNLKLITLKKIFEQNTDEDHPLSVKQIIEELARYGIPCERKSVYSDIEALRSFGMDIVCLHTHCNMYYLASRLFETAELKLLADAVSSSVFITEKKSDELIEKLSKLASTPAARQIQRQVFVRGRAKSGNEHIYYNIDAIHRAISLKKKISFRYFDYTAEKDSSGLPLKKYRNDGAKRIVTPIALIWDNENYYLCAYSQEKRRQANFRIDKMDGVDVTEFDADTAAADFDAAGYSKKVFGMYSGRPIHAAIRTDKRIIGNFYDKFGQDLRVLQNGEDDTALVVTEVEISPPFIGWLLQFGNMIKVEAPQELKEEMRDCLRAAAENL